MRRCAVLTALSALLGLGLNGVLRAQDFQRTFPLPAGGVVKIGNISGDIDVTGYDGTGIVVTGRKTGADKDRVTVEDVSAADRIDIKVRYPQGGTGDASVSFDIKVPRAVRYSFEKLYSVSGSISVKGVTAQMRAETVSGNVYVQDVSGVVSASTVSGNVTVEIRQLDASGDMKFQSVSGNVAVKAPANLDADVEMSTISGGLKTDFPIEVIEPRYGPGRVAKGRIGSGMRNLHIRSVSGRVSLSRM
jgi:hypothetical protein